ncbi:TIM barrel protein [Mesorhizobium sp. BAC0120]|uniref:hydroxypyruvate isomerase family protein n=1 Tax=Mesorhizobium sp. BAC0120 TaxID=3090670 RepID=UPI00298D40C7|nr:TIM barrel protein [Mesorhizobium sp. BAC0120]MDW6023762.1 TIM barrel protein [Mesorhizobium sp. BAC0120]
MRISANLGFLFREFELPEAIRAAKRQGFDAVEMHWPYETDASAVAAALAETGLPLLGVNTARGDVAAGDFGLSALPERQAEARAAIDQAVAWSVVTGCRNIHVMAGRSAGERAFQAFTDNLRYAVEKASPHGIGILIEPLNPRDAPGYFLADLPTALRVIEATDGAVRVMYDCYHMQIVHGDLLRTVEQHLDAIGHIQFAAVPDRAEPDHGEVNFGWLLPAFASAGYSGFFGAEYKQLSGSFAWLGDYGER